MPVADHPTHESTRLYSSKPWGCWNKSHKRGYFAAADEMERMA